MEYVPDSAPEIVPPLKVIESAVFGELETGENKFPARNVPSASDALVCAWKNPKPTFADVFNMYPSLTSSR